MEDMDSKLNAMLNDPAAMAVLSRWPAAFRWGSAGQPSAVSPPHGAPPPPADGGFDPMLLAVFCRSCRICGSPTARRHSFSMRCVRF